MSASGISIDIPRELRAICGEACVRESQTASTIVGQPEGIACSPASAEEVGAILRLANQYALSVVPIGGLTGPSFERRTDIALDTSRLNAVEHYDAGDLTVGIGSGTTVAHLNAMLAPDRLLFAADPAFPERSTIGGVLAAAKQGPLRHGYGGVRDFCIGIRFVTGDGRLAKGGGRVVKNVAGYDLMKLLIGSYGTLAVITSASFKLFPAPRQTRTFLAEFASAGEALQFRDLVQRSPLSPMCLELVSPEARKLMRPEMTADSWVMCVRASGSDAVLARYRKELGSAVTREIAGGDESAMWSAIDGFPVAFSAGSTRWLYASVGAPIAEIGRVIALLQEPGNEHGPLPLVGRVGVGNLVLALDAASQHVWSGMLEALAARLSRDCSITVQGPGKLVRLTPSNLDVMRAVKHALDPNNILRGRELF